MERSRYPMPLYLNQKYVFDILAMMEGGFSQLEKVKTTQDDSTESSRRLSADVGVKNVFAFLGVSVGGEQSGKDAAKSSIETLEERVYTPNSLFDRMRANLYDQDLIVHSDMSKAHPGCFVEFQAALSRSPLVHTLSTLEAALRMAMIFPQPEHKPAPIQGLSTGRQRAGVGRQAAPHNADPANVTKTTQRQIEGLLSQLDSASTVDLVGETVVPAKIGVVLALDKSYLGDPSLSDLVDGEYTVLGKVTKKVEAGGETPINLLRNTSLSMATEAFLDGIIQPLMNIPNLNIPELRTKVQGPAIQVIPIAIFT